MKPWYRIRHLSPFVKMFYESVGANDPLAAGAIYGLLFDFLQSARIYAQDNRVKPRWKPVIAYLESELDDIQKKAMDYPMPVQQALVAKVTFYQNAKIRGL